MTYKIKCLQGVHSKGDFSITKGQELEVSKEIYDYFNTNFGTSGKFNFATVEGTKKVTKSEKDIVSEKPKTKVSTRKSKEDS